MEKPKFVYVTHINATPAKVWDALTKPEFTEQFFGGRKVRSPWTVGSNIEFILPNGEVEIAGEILEIIPGKLLVSTHNPSTTPEHPTRLTFAISETLGVTTLTITHEGFAAGSEIIPQVSAAWQIMASTIKTFLETGKPLPFNAPHCPC